MKAERVEIEGIPALIWGEPSDRVFLCVHGKMSSKESAEGLAWIAAEKGCQTICFDLPQHGERIKEPRRCDIWNGIQDLTVVGKYVFSGWKDVSLYACSLGAYFSLHAYQGRRFTKCLFQSPIVNMEYLIQQMFRWFDISPERLAREKEIETPIDLMTWDYYQYVLAHPVRRWDSPASILYGGRDDLQSQSVMRNFAGRTGSSITLAEDSEHSFMGEKDVVIVQQWLHDHI